MKLQFIVLVLCLGLVVNQSDDVTADQMVQYIRNRGTFLASVVNMTQRVDNTDSVRQEALDAFKALVNIEFGSEYALKLNDSEYNYYNNTEIELPVICNPDKNAQSDRNTGISGLSNEFL